MSTLTLSTKQHIQILSGAFILFIGSLFGYGSHEGAISDPG